jgi:Iodothyronine deiodinase
MYKRYKDGVAFLGVYVREAHPTDGWFLEGNSRVGIEEKQPTNQTERFDVAAKCCRRLEMTIPLAVDALDDRVGRAYSGMPDRLYLIDRQGRVAYKGGRGPYGFKPAELEQSLILLLQEEMASTRHLHAAARDDDPPRR